MHSAALSWGVNIGFSPKDEEARRFLDQAGMQGRSPQFVHGTGAFVEVVFPPSILGDDIPTLYGWMERLQGNDVLYAAGEQYPDLLEQDSSSEERLNASTQAHDSAPAVKDSIQYLLTSQLTYLLHVWSTPHASRALAESLGQQAYVPSSIPATLPSSALSMEASSIKEIDARDDTEMVSNAVESILRYGQALIADPLAEEIVVDGVDADAEYIEFVTCRK